MLNCWLKRNLAFTARPPGGTTFSLTLLEDQPGFAAALVSGPGADTLFEQECGGHRWQRVPPTERHGRIHTSTITVAILPAETPIDTVDDCDIEVITTKGRGPGGQHRNKTESTVVAIHRPTRISVRLDERSQHQNKREAKRRLKARVTSNMGAKKRTARNTNRRHQIGSGMRGDKIRTYRERDNLIIDHRTNAKGRLSDWMEGSW